MRYLAVFASLLALSALRAEPPSEAKVPWADPFETISPSAAESQFVMLVITNEDPYLVEEVRERASEAAERDEVELSESPPVWCSEVLENSFRRALLVRPDLTDKLKIQVLVAGLPMQITGGQPGNTPARAVVLICDGRYRLLALGVGVPDSDHLLTMIEDAEDVRQTLDLQANIEQRELASVLAQRNRSRLSRLWRNVLDEMLLSADGETEQAQRADAADAFRGKVQSLTESLEPAYNVDVRLRFGLNDAADRRRLAILEQHTETRRSWCDTMIPFVAGIDVIEHWREFVESVWGFSPVTTMDDSDELNRWVEQQLPSNQVVLMVEPPRQVAHLPWPPVTSQKRGVAWQEVHDSAMTYPFRTAGPQQLASLIRDRELNPIDLRQPALARYVVLQQGDAKPMVIRESDSPGYFATVLKRSPPRTVEN